MVGGSQVSPSDWLARRARIRGVEDPSYSATILRMGLHAPANGRGRYASECNGWRRCCSPLIARANVYSEFSHTIACHRVRTPSPIAQNAYPNVTPPS